MSEITILHLNDGRMIIGYIEEQTDEQITIMHPVVMLLSNPYSLTTSVAGYKYSPFADDSTVMFNKPSIQSFAIPQERIAGFYEELVKYHQSVEIKYAPGDSIGGPSAEEFLDQLEEELDNDTDEETANEAVIIPFNKNKNTVH
jgi:hypothetical protein